MIRACRSAGAFGFLLAALAASSGAQTPAASAAADGAPAMESRASGVAKALAMADRNFLRDAAHSGHAEVEAGRLAVHKGTHAEVKAFAQRMVDDHGKASGELAALAVLKGYRLPNEPSLKQQAQLKLLVRRGESFDRQYAESQVQAHRDAVRLFEKAARSKGDADVAAYAEKTLPTLRKHLQDAEALRAAVK